MNSKQVVSRVVDCRQSSSATSLSTSWKKYNDGHGRSRPQLDLNSSNIFHGYHLQCSRDHGHQMREYRALDVKNGVQVRIHRLLDDSNCRQKLLWLRHRGTLNYWHCFINDGYIHLVSDSQQTNVLKYIEDNAISLGHNREQLVRRWTFQVLEALNYGQHLGIYHNDFRWDEIHIDNDLNASLGNYGQMTVNNDDHTEVGWSIGANVFELLFDVGVAGASITLLQQSKSLIHRPPPVISLQARDFLRFCLLNVTTPTPDVNDMLQHSWMQKSSDDFFVQSDGSSENDLRNCVANLFQRKVKPNGQRRSSEDTNLPSVRCNKEQRHRHRRRQHRLDNGDDKLLNIRRRPLTFLLIALLLLGLLVVGFFYYNQTNLVHPSVLNSITIYSKYLLRSIFFAFI